MVPGDWSEPDLEFQAEHVATTKMHNGGFNCIASQVLVLAEGWEQRDASSTPSSRRSTVCPSAPAYYPGADDRLATLRQSYPDAQSVGTGGTRTLVR